MVVNTHPGASQRGDDGTWWRADICVESFKRWIYRDCPRLTFMCIILYAFALQRRSGGCRDVMYEG